MNEELDRVRADLATMKSVCVEPAIPREDISINLIMAVCGILIAVAPWFVPMFWVKIGTVLGVIVPLAFYVPRKRRILKRDPAGRRLEIKEIKIWTVVLFGYVGYMLFHRFFWPGGAGYSEQMWRQDAGAGVFFVGLGFVANGLIHPTRKDRIVPALILITGGLLVQFATNGPETLTILGCAMTLSCLVSAARIAWLTRRERLEHVGH